MSRITAHEKIKTQITAFLINTRADVVRGEMYRILCLYVLTEIERGSFEDIMETVAYAIDSDLHITDAMRAIVSDELNTLVEKGDLEFINNSYSIVEDAKIDLPDQSVEREVLKGIEDEVNRIALDMDSSLTSKERKTLFEFYLDVCYRVLEDQLASVSKGLGIESVSAGYADISIIIEVVRRRSGIEINVDLNEFVKRTITDPTDILAQFLFQLLQVSIVFQLLAWDPTLEDLKNNILSNKTLYLDTNILFTLVLKSHRLHDFMTSVIATSTRELGVTVKIQKITLDEYKNVIWSKTEEFNKSRYVLRQLALKTLEEGIKPADTALSDDIFVDYMTEHTEHIDLGSWQRYANRITGVDLDALLRRLRVTVDSENTFVPYPDYSKISQNMLEASRIHARKGTGRSIKADVRHDCQLFYLIQKNRAKVADIGLGYDTYLLTFDGSLVSFTREHGLSWLDTYFVFPNQWYELTFPFMRLKLQENPRTIRELLSLSLSPIASTLSSLVPINLYGYLFENGAAVLSFSSLAHLIQGLMEQRLVDSIDPDQRSKKHAEEAELEVRRLIADEYIEEGIVQREILDKTEKLRDRQRSLEERIENATNELSKITSKSTAAVERRQVLLDDIKRYEKSLGQYKQLEVQLKQQGRELQEQNQELQSLRMQLNQAEAENSNEQKRIAKRYERKFDKLQEQLDDLVAVQQTQRQHITNLFRGVGIVMLILIIGSVIALPLIGLLPISIGYQISASFILIVAVVMYFFRTNLIWIGVLVTLALIIFFVPIINTPENSDIAWLLSIILIPLTLWLLDLLKDFLLKSPLTKE